MKKPPHYTRDKFRRRLAKLLRRAADVVEARQTRDGATYIYWTWTKTSTKPPMKGD